MNYEVEKLDGSVKFTFTIASEEWDEQLNKSYLKNKNKYNIPGFRRGHATRRMIENMYGVGVFFDDAFSRCFKDVYSTALDENADVYPVDEPDIDIMDINEEGLKFVAIVTVRPEVKLGEYKGLKIDKAEYPVTDELINAQIEKTREKLSRKVKVEDRAAQKDDITTIDYSGSVDGEKFEGGTAENAELILGSGSFIPGFEDQVIGMKIGETRDINVKFPEEYHAENLKGKDAVFTVKLNGIMAKELPELNDEFAKDLGEFETLKDYKDKIKSDLEKENNRREEMENENNLIERIVENTTCAIPDCMVQSQINYMVEDFKNRLAQMYGGLKFEDYLKYIGSDMEAFRKDRFEEAEKNVKTRLTIEELIKAEKIEATEDELDEKIKEISEKAQKDSEQYKQELSPIQIGYIKNDIVINKLMKFLQKNNTFEKAKKTSK